MIHRDLKPSNIMVGAFGEVQLMDWGLAKILATGGVVDEMRVLGQQQDESTSQTRQAEDSSTPVGGPRTAAGSVTGTPAYMAPEQALGEVDRLDERADVFGLGAILCELLTHRPPYTGKGTRKVFIQAARGKLDGRWERGGAEKQHAKGGLHGNLCGGVGRVVEGHRPR